jgi:hypothetical protein
VKRSNDWGFPRWRGYGSSREATEVRICDRHGCNEPGDRPAPKSPNSPERWYFCEKHAAEYNRNWNYFEGLTKEQREERERDEQRSAEGYAESSHYGWGGPGDGSRSADEMRALEIFELDPDAEFDAVKKAWRQLAKANHPDGKSCARPRNGANGRAIRRSARRFRGLAKSCSGCPEYGSN